MQTRTISASRWPQGALATSVLQTALLVLFAATFAQFARAAAVVQQASQSQATIAAVQSRDHKAFGHALPQATEAAFVRMLEGKKIFSRQWLPAGRGPLEHQGLGPLFNAASCIACHFRDGRGGPQGTPPPLIFRVLEPVDQTATASEVTAADLTRLWGRQLQDQAVSADPEGRVAVQFEELSGRFADGTRYTLRRPRYEMPELNDAALHLGPRMPPTLVGVGLLEAVAERTILAWADPQDADGNGISGRPKILHEGGRTRLGRFGWKAEQADLAQQVAGALAEDMGITSAARATAGETPEINREDFEALIDYLRLLAPPAPRADDPLYARGSRVFERLQCGACHRPRLVTGDAGLHIEPYTDLLLHDLGRELADGDGSSSAQREWRTAPLWGLGLMEVVNGQLRLLHDGRADSFEAAILWHGGEARLSRERFVTLEKADRDALIAFLQSI